MKKRVVSCIFALTIGCATIFAGCTSNGRASENTRETKTVENKVEKIKISAINAISWAPVFIAQTEGFFEKEGVEAEFTTPGGPKGFQAMHAGDCDFAMLSQEPLLMAQEKGMESTVIAATLKTRVYGLISREDITDISQLKGKTIFGSDPGSAPYTFVSNVLSMSGIDPMNDISFIQITDNNAGLQAFLKGEVDAAFVNMYTLPAAGDFKYNILADCTQPDQCEKYLGSAEFPGEMLCTTKAYAEENPATCQKVVNGVMEAQKWISEHTDDEVAASLKPIFGDIDEKVISQQVALVRDEYAVDCMVTEKGEKAVIDMCVKAGIISKEIAYGDVIDMSFVKNHK